MCGSGSGSCGAANIIALDSKIQQNYAGSVVALMGNNRAYADVQSLCSLFRSSQSLRISSCGAWMASDVLVFPSSMMNKVSAPKEEVTLGYW